MKKYILLLAMTILVATGCQSTNMLTKLPTPWKKTDTELAAEDATDSDTEFSTPQTMVCVWKDGTLETDGKRIRGLAGRVYFNDAKQNPLKVDGTFAVYAYTSNGILGPSKIEPQRKFVFDRSNLEKHYSESEIGSSYSFWLPWDEVGGEETCITLLPIMKTTDGRIVRGEEQEAILPGRKRNVIDSDIQELRQQLQQNRQVLYESSDFDQHVQRQRLMRTDTIRVPGHADAVRQAMKQPQQLPAKADAISTSVDNDASQVRTAAATMPEAANDQVSQATTATRLPTQSQQAWETTLDAFRSRGAANNERFDPRSIQRF